MISVLILTNDEEINIGRCGESILGAVNIEVLDSFSTYRTVKTAQTAGALYPS